MSVKRRHPFEQLREKISFSDRLDAAPPVFFQIRFVEDTACLFIIDHSGKEIEADYHNYNGQIREVLKVLHLIQDKKSVAVEWESDSEEIELAENEFLLWLLKDNNYFVDQNMSPIQFMDGQAHIELTINGENQLDCCLEILYEHQKISDIQFVSDNHVFSNGRIYPISPISAGYQLLVSFEATILPSEIEKYLSLFYSHFKNIKVRYRNFHVVKGPIRKTHPSLVFEKVDADNSLYLRVSNTLSGLEPDFFENYDLTYVVSLNPLESLIIVSELEYESTFPTEKKLKRLLNQYKKELDNDETGYYQEGDLIIVEGALAFKLIRESLPKMMSEFRIFGSEKLKSYKVRSVKPELILSLNHQIDFLEGDVDLLIEGETFSLFEALYQYRKQSYVQLNDGTHALLNPDYIEKLERLFQKKKDKTRVSFFDLPLIEDFIDEETAEETFGVSREVFKGFNNLKDSTENLPQLPVNFRPYQIDGYHWLKYLQKHGLGGCLADDMGLGKTLQAITLLSSLYPEEALPSLIVIPKSLIFNWQNEIKKFNPKLTYYAYYGPDRDITPLKQHHIIITTYATLRNDIEVLKEVSFNYVILDESQNIKNVNSQISRAVMLLKSKNRLALSGTPIENNLSELYSLFRFLNPSMFGSLQKFYRDYLVPIQNFADKDAAHELRRKIYPFVLRREKKDVLKDLPDKIEQILLVDMGEDQKKFYEQRRQFYYDSVFDQIEMEGIESSGFHVLQAITELRQIASIPEIKSEGQIISRKREMLLESLLESIANDHKVLLFANFLGILEILSEDLKSRNIDYEVMTGATQNRERIIQRFLNDFNCKVFLMTLKTGGQGLNLTAADTVYIYDPWWNLAAEKQAIDRSHRIGQDKTVFSYKLITKGTIEEKILQLQERKRDLVENFISIDTTSLKFMDEEDINFILGEI